MLEDSQDIPEKAPNGRPLPDDAPRQTVPEKATRSKTAAPRFTIGPLVQRRVLEKESPGQEISRRSRSLWIYALDPSTSRLAGAEAKIDVPYEPLEPGPRGAMFEVVDRVPNSELRYLPVDLELERHLLEGGRKPSPTDPQFHQQMVYAVACKVVGAFRSALGREPSWGFEASRTGRDPRVLRLEPHAFVGRNAQYRKEAGAIEFGYFKADELADSRGSMPGGYVFTCLSHDVIAHEVTHALLDGMRNQFLVPTHIDVPAFHEAFSDLVALFQHFSYPEVVLAAIRLSGGSLSKANLLTDLAAQFGRTLGLGTALRTATDFDLGVERTPYENAGHDPHQLGSVLVNAVFEAFVTVYERRCEKYWRLAGLPAARAEQGAVADLPYELQRVLAYEAKKVALQFQSICIRAVDYCPPVDLRFGDYLRALITADHELVPDDPYAYREAIIDSFRSRGIFPQAVPMLSEGALLYAGPEEPFMIPKLAFSKMPLRGSRRLFEASKAVMEHARALGESISESPRALRQFGLVEQGAPELANDTVDLPVIESIRTARRPGPDRNILFDFVAEVTQRRHVRPHDLSPRFDVLGGATIFIDPKGRVRLVIKKSILDEERIKQQRRDMTQTGLGRLWHEIDGEWNPRPGVFQLLHQQAGATSWSSGSGD